MKSTLKYLLFLYIAISIFATCVKIHSYFFTPKVKNWNMNKLAEIKADKDSFSFAVFGDNKNSSIFFDNLISAISKDNVNFAIDNGDLVYNSSIYNYSFFLKQLKLSHKPILTVVGNHDVKKFGPDNYKKLFGKLYYSFSILNSYFIFLDTSNEKILDAKQLVWLKNELKISQNYQYKFVFMHVPLFDPRAGVRKTGHSLKNYKFAQELNNIFDKNNVTMIFASHIHGYFKGFWNRTPYIISGGAGARLVHSKEEHKFYHYIKVFVSSKNITYKVIKINQPKFSFISRQTNEAFINCYVFCANFYWYIMLLFLVSLTLFNKDKIINIVTKTSKK